MNFYDLSCGVSTLIDLRILSTQFSLCERYFYLIKSYGKLLER